VPKRRPGVRQEPVSARPAEAEVLQASIGSRDLLPWLLLAAASGCAALIYEIVWFQLLQLVIGSSAVSLGLLLAAYMGGLCIGSAALPRLVSAARHPMRVYAALEIGIGAFGILALFGIPLMSRISVAGGTTGLAGLVLRGVIAAVWLLPPTLLMGGSLPAAARWVETTPKGISWLGLFYSANIAGAVTGCLTAGFYLLRVHDMGVATYTAAAINAAAALLAFRLAAPAKREGQSETFWTPPAHEAQSLPSRASRPVVYMVYLAIALSGLSALGAEVVWTRLLSLMLGATVYTFSIILAVFLIGLWAGSGAGSFWARRVNDSRLALAACQLLLAAAIAWTAFTIAGVLPYWPVDPSLAISPWFIFDLDLTRCIRTILPATLLWGASFPLALAAASRGGDPARLAGEVYAANTAGSIVGALAFSLAFIPALGTRGSERLLLWLAAAGAIAALAAAVLSARGKQSSTPWPHKARGVLAGVAMAGAAALAWGLSATVPEMPWQVTAYGRRVAPILRGFDADLRPAQPLYVGEGVSSSVVIAQRGDQRFFYVSGKSEASSAPLDMRLQRMMGHLPALLDASPRSVLVVGFGAGVTAGSFVPYPEVRRIVICELEPLIPPASGEYFRAQNYNVLHDPRTRVVYDDARHYVLASPQKFDVITTDPIHPWVKGTSVLYSKEYYELVKQHLNPGGVAAQWLPLYESDEETVRTELATFFAVFPRATVWSNFENGDGYDLVLLGREDDSPINVDKLQERLDRPESARIAASLAETGFHSAVDLLATYAGRAPDLEAMLTGARINDDLNLRLQYMAGLGLNSVDAPRIYRDILSYRRFPEGMLTGSSARVGQLRALLERAERTF
jgi:spermidine synthase